jgi:hypothetical protein
VSRKALATLERPTGFEPATSSLGMRRTPPGFSPPMVNLDQMLGIYLGMLEARVQARGDG